MNKATSALLILGFAFMGCSNSGNLNTQTQKADSTANEIKKDMENMVSIVEIPTADFSRAVTFYQTILAVTIQEIDMEGTRMGLLPSDGKTVSVALIKGSDYKPSLDGTIVYLNAGSDLQTVLDKIEPNGGKILIPKTAISPEIGFFAMFTDTEGSKLGLHSKN
jgi:uncharacterized protein